MARFTCSFFLHVQLYPQYKVSLGMIRFALHNFNRFKAKSTIPLILCIFKISGAIIATLGSQYLIVQAKTVKEALIFYMGMFIVAQIGNIMALTVTNVDIGSEINKESNIIYLEDQDTK